MLSGNLVHPTHHTSHPTRDRATTPIRNVSPLFNETHPPNPRYTHLLQGTQHDAVLHDTNAHKTRSVLFCVNLT